MARVLTVFALFVLLAADLTSKIGLYQPAGVGLISMLALAQAHSQSCAMN